jgi:hypothetical protein
MFEFLEFSSPFSTRADPTNPANQAFSPACTDISTEENGNMRKRIIDSSPALSKSSEVGWLDLEHIASVEVTSEDANFPIESVFSAEDGPGWRASQKGEQRIRIIFDEPVSLHRIQLRFVEPELERTQEFTLRWSSARGGPIREIVRQQWNFSPRGSTAEVEDYEVNLEGVSVLELALKPDLTGGEAPATLALWHVV